MGYPVLKNIKILSGNSNIPLAEKICKNLNIPLGRANVKRFSDGEIHDLINSGWKVSDPPPVLPPEVVANTRKRYLEALERLTGKGLES